MKSKLSSVPIINFSRESPEFKAKMLDFLMENSIDFDRNFHSKEQSCDSLEKANVSTFNAMIRIFNIKKNQEMKKKLPQQIRYSIYQNLLSHKIDENLKKERLKSKSPPKKEKKKKAPNINKTNNLSVEKPKNFTHIRASVYSHLVKHIPVPKPPKNYEEINKIYKTPKKKLRDSKEKSKSSDKSASKSMSSNVKTPEKPKKPIIEHDNNRYKTTISKTQYNTSKKTEKTNTISQLSDWKSQTNKPKAKQDEISTTKKGKSTTPLNFANKNKDNMKIKPFGKKPQTYTKNSEVSSSEIPSMNLSFFNRINEDILNKTYEFKKSDYSFHAANSDEELKELCDKIKPKSTFHENLKNHQNHYEKTSGTCQENESFRKRDDILEDISHNKKSSSDDLNNNNNNESNNVELVEKLEKQLKILESKKLIQQNNDETGNIQKRFEEEFKNTLRQNSHEILDASQNTDLNKNFDKMVNRFFIGLEFLSTEELIFYYSFIVNRAKILYIKFLKNRGAIN